MTVGSYANPAKAWRPALWWLGALALAAFCLWLTADQDIAALESPHDDQFFLERAVCGYWFDQGYTHMAFIKDPVYPFFVALCYRLDIPLRPATEVVYLLTAAFFSWTLVRGGARPWVGLAVFAACALHPMRFAVFGQATSEALYPSLLQLALGALLLQTQDQGKPSAWRRGLFSGLCVALLWNTRPDKPLVALLLLAFLAAGAYRARRTAPGWRSALKPWLAEWGWPPLVVAALTLAIMTANYARFGIFASTDLSAPGFRAACDVLTAIRPERSMRFVPVTREARLRAYAVSPSFRELEPYLEGKLGAWYAGPGKVYYGLPQGEIAGGWFFWALRDAAAEAGHCGSAADSEAYYRRIVEELRTAAAKGRLAMRPVLPFGLAPCPEDYLPHLPESVAKLWARCWSGEEPAPLRDHPTEIYRLFDTVAHRRPVPASPTTQSHIRSWLWPVYGPLLKLLLVVGVGICVGMLLLRRGGVRREGYFFVGLILALAGLSRLGLFALIDASICPGDALRYLFPAALSLAVLAVWLSGEGARLLLGTGK